MKKNIIVFMILIILSTSFLFSNDIFTIGSEQNEGELFYPQIIKEGPDGNIYISDSKDSFIKVYSPSGKYLYRIGGKGEGPGQMKRMGAFGFDEDKKLLYFSEYFGGHSWITYMKLDGKFDSVQKLNIKRRFGLYTIINLPNDQFIAKINYTGEIKKKSDHFEYKYPRAIVIIDKKGRIIKELIKTNYIDSISMIGDGADLPIPYVPKFYWVRLKDRIVFADGLSRKFKLIDLNGKNIGSILTPLPVPEKVTDTDLIKWRKLKKDSFSRRDRSWYNRFGKVVDKYKKSIYKFKPNISEMSLTPNQNILIGGAEKSGIEKTDFWLITTKGEIITSFSAKIEDITITKNFILFKSTDEDENTIINCFSRKGTEKEDLLKAIKSY